ncbi:MAG: HAMP domain-containing histidine kinase [Betaproteobacteria bacterium]|nr:HAMP domain-containing histidine kinase [Betaproteobacteria bacterium]
MPLTTAERIITQFRLHLSFLGLLLLAALTIAGVTVYALKGQQAQMTMAIRESQQQALELLAGRVEESILNAMRAPFQTLRSIGPRAANAEHLRMLQETSPSVEQILFLDRNMTVAWRIPFHLGREDDRITNWVIQRVPRRQARATPSRFLLTTFLETINGKPTLFAYEAIDETSVRSSGNPLVLLGGNGWLVVRFKLDALQEHSVFPLLADFTRDQGGAVNLHNPGFEIKKESLNSPLTHVLPGWKLVYEPPSQATKRRLAGQRWVIIGIVGGVLIAIAITGYAVWREILREKTLVDLRNRFVANVSHELKTPLALIRMYAETLSLQRLKDQNRQHEYHKVILREAERLSRMIENVLDFERLRSGVEVYHLTETDLAASVADVLARYESQLEDRGVRLDVKLEHPLPPVAHDKEGLTEILLNLLDNAGKYAESGGLVQVQLARINDRVELRVSDFGPGIPPQDRVRMRKAFERGVVPSAASGSGLGLALVEQIAKSHHAHFILGEPEGHSGVKAVVSFPISQGEA